MRLFVYGTLKRGERRHGHLSGQTLSPWLARDRSIGFTISANTPGLSEGQTDWQSKANSGKSTRPA